MAEVIFLVIFFVGFVAILFWTGSIIMGTVDWLVECHRLKAASAALKALPDMTAADLGLNPDGSLHQ